MSSAPGGEERATTAPGASASGSQRSPLRLFVRILRQNMRWWLIPLILAFLLIAALHFLARSSEPFVYTLF